MTDHAVSMREPMAEEGPAPAPTSGLEDRPQCFWCFNSFWSDRLVRLVEEAEEDDSRWSRWFSNGVLLPKEFSDRYRLSCAAILIVCAFLQTAVSIWMHGVEGLRVNFSFLTVWGLYINMVYFCTLGAYILKISPFGQSCHLKWISLLGQFALVVETLILILYFTLIFFDDFPAKNGDAMFWFSLMFEHIACPLFVIIDFGFGRVPYSRRLLILLSFLFYLYAGLLYYTTIVDGPLYPGIDFTNAYTLECAFLAQVLIICIGYGAYCWRRQQEPYVVETLMHHETWSAEPRSDHLLREIA